MTSGCTAALALPFPNAHFIWYCAWFSIPSAIYAYSHPASTHLAIIPASVWATYPSSTGATPSAIRGAGLWI